MRRAFLYDSVVSLFFLNPVSLLFAAIVHVPSFSVPVPRFFYSPGFSCRPLTLPPAAVLRLSGLRLSFTLPSFPLLSPSCQLDFDLHLPLTQASQLTFYVSTARGCFFHTSDLPPLSSHYHFSTVLVLTTNPGSRLKPPHAHRPGGVLFPRTSIRSLALARKAERILLAPPSAFTSAYRLHTRQRISINTYRSSFYSHRKKCAVPSRLVTKRTPPSPGPFDPPFSLFFRPVAFPLRTDALQSGNLQNGSFVLFPAPAVPTLPRRRRFQAPQFPKSGFCDQTFDKTHRFPLLLYSLTYALFRQFLLVSRLR